MGTLFGAATTKEGEPHAMQTGPTLVTGCSAFSQPPSRERLREMAGRRGVQHVANQAGCAALFGDFESRITSSTQPAFPAFPARKPSDPFADRFQ